MGEVHEVRSNSSLQRFHSLISVSQVEVAKEDKDAHSQLRVQDRQQITRNTEASPHSLDKGEEKGKSQTYPPIARHSTSKLYQVLSKKLESNINSLFKILSSSSSGDEHEDTEVGEAEDNNEEKDELEENDEHEESEDIEDRYDDDHADKFDDKDEEEESEDNSEESIKMELIERYMTNYSYYRYICKKNAFLQDKLHQICCRKGFIVENHEKKDNLNQTTVVKNWKRKRSKVLIKDLPKLEGPKDTKNDNEIKGKRQETSVDADELLEHDDGLTISENYSNNNNSTNIKGHKNSISKDNLLLTSKLLDADNMENDQMGNLLHGFKLHNLAAKYKKVVQHMWGLEESKLVTGETENAHLIELRSKKDASDEKCKTFFVQFMKRVAQSSREAIISNTGVHLNSVETDHYIMEMTKLFDKLRQTTLQFYITWHGLNFELNSLEESHEAGVQILEYEQLCAENYTLKEKVEYTEQELEKEKAKISHCIQILAHVKDKEIHLDDTLESANINIKILNKRLKLLSQIMDSVTVAYSTLREEQKDLEEHSKLVENPKLMKDFEKTNYEIAELKQQRTDISVKVRRSELEKIELNNKIQCVKTQKQTLQNMVVKKNSDAKEEAMKKRQMEIKKADEKQKKMDNLLRLLETQTTEPWNIVKDEMIVVRDMYYYQPNSCQNVSVQ